MLVETCSICSGIYTAWFEDTCMFFIKTCFAHKLIDHYALSITTYMYVAIIHKLGITSQQFIPTIHCILTSYVCTYYICTYVATYVCIYTLYNCSCRAWNKDFELVGPFTKIKNILMVNQCYSKVVLAFRFCLAKMTKLVRKWPITDCYFKLCSCQLWFLNYAYLYCFTYVVAVSI